MNTTKRRANIELLRVVCMILIIFHHITPWVDSEYALGANTKTIDACLFLVNRFFNFHVDVFILISGYFGIRNSLKKLVSILVLLWFYSILLNCISFFKTETIDWRFLVCPVQENPWWFMCNYVYLLLLSPFINKITDNIKTSLEWFHLLGVCLLFDIFFCWILDDPKLNFWGHNITTFITMYIIGRWLSTHYSTPFVNKLKIIGKGNLTITFVAICMGVVIISVINHLGHFELTLPDYNSPTTIVAGVVFFLAFKEWNVKPRKSITFLSESAVAVYLVHSNNIIEPLLIKMFWRGYTKISNDITALVYIALFVTLLYVTICVFDKIRIFITTPVISFFNKKFSIRTEL